MKKFLDPDHPALRPLWVRLAIVGLAGGWAALEFVAGSAGWGMLVLAFAAYGGWVLLLGHGRDSG